MVLPHWLSFEETAELVKDRLESRSAAPTRPERGSVDNEESPSPQKPGRAAGQRSTRGASKLSQLSSRVVAVPSGSWESPLSHPVPASAPSAGGTGEVGWGFLWLPGCFQVIFPEVPQDRSQPHVHADLHGKLGTPPPWMRRAGLPGTSSCCAATDISAQPLSHPLQQNKSRKSVDELWKKKDIKVVRFAVIKVTWDPVVRMVAQPQNTLHIKESCALRVNFVICELYFK